MMVRAMLYIYSYENEHQYFSKEFETVIESVRQTKKVRSIEIGKCSMVQGQDSSPFF